MELSFLVDALKSLLINYTSNNSQIDESLNDLFSSLESKNLNNEIENYAEFILLASSLFELKAKRMLPQEEEIEWMDEVEVLKDKDLAFARLLQFKAFSEIGIALASKIKYNENEIKSFKYYQTKNLFPKPDVEYEINKDKFNEVAIEVFDRFKTIEGFKHIDKDLPDLQKAIDDLLQVVDKRLNTSFESILNEVNTEKEAIAFFLALLEAVRWGFVKASQNDDGIKIEKIMNYKKVITAILLVSDGSVNHKYFLENFNISNEDLVNIFDEINDELKEKDYGFYIKYDGKSSDLVTLSSISTELAEFKPPSVLRGLSTPALETLSIVAYEQPVTKLKVSEIRGVESESSLKTLESRGLIEKSGYLDVPGNPHLYITTNLFLEKMDISSIDDLPVLGEYFSNLEEE